jgi:hypothetical protein
MSRSRFSIVFILTIALGFLLIRRGRVEVSALSNAQAVSSKSSPPERRLKPTRPGVERENKKQEAARPEIPFEQKAYCRLKKADLGIPLDGQLKIVAFSYEADEDNQSGFVAFVSSSHCPENGFSKICMDSLGRIESVLDCRRMNNSEIALQSGIQGNIVDSPSEGDVRNFAVSGEGFFVTDCAGGIVLQRSGGFQFKSGKLWHGNCEVLDQFGEPISENVTQLDEHGCTPSGACLALATIPDFQGKPADRTSIAIDESKLQFLSEGYIFSHSLEDFADAQSGPFGPDWKELPIFHPMACIEEN